MSKSFWGALLRYSFNLSPKMVIFLIIWGTFSTLNRIFYESIPNHPKESSSSLPPSLSSRAWWSPGGRVEKAGEDGGREVGIFRGEGGDWVWAIEDSMKNLKNLSWPGSGEGEQAERGDEWLTASDEGEADQPRCRSLGSAGRGGNADEPQDTNYFQSEQEMAGYFQNSLNLKFTCQVKKLADMGGVTEDLGVISSKVRDAE